MIKVWPPPTSRSSTTGLIKFQLYTSICSRTDWQSFSKFKMLQYVLGFLFSSKIICFVFSISSKFFFFSRFSLLKILWLCSVFQFLCKKSLIFFLCEFYHFVEIEARHTCYHSSVQFVPILFQILVLRMCVHDVFVCVVAHKYAFYVCCADMCTWCAWLRTNMPSCIFVCMMYMRNMVCVYIYVYMICVDGVCSCVQICLSCMSCVYMYMCTRCVWSRKNMLIVCTLGCVWLCTIATGIFVEFLLVFARS